MIDAMQNLSERLQDDGSLDLPEVGSLKEFLLTHARVKGKGGEYFRYTFEGREGLEEIVDTFDLVLGSHTGEILPDATIDICGGAQFGKTIFALNAGAYFTSRLFYNWGYYLPDDDLVEGIVDTKLRPDVIEQIDWLGPMMEVGKLEDKRGRAVNRKGAFRVTDGIRKAFGMIRGMGKIPTSFSMDVSMEDEKDDIDAGRSKFLAGRMTASDQRLRSSIGTQRVFGRGQNKQFRDGSQGVEMFAIPGGEINLEENWPQICRLAVSGSPRPDDPKATYTGDFARERDGNLERFAYSPSGVFYLADPETGAVIDRSAPRWEHRRPERLKMLKFSFRLSQLGVAAMDLRQIVSRWQDAVKDPESMVVFQCDVLAIPNNTSQAISEKIVERSQKLDGGYDLSLSSGEATAPRFAGLDTGERCWFVCREVESAGVKRIPWAEKIALGDVVARTVTLCQVLQTQMLLIDARPHASEARQICMTLNGLEGIDWPVVNDPDKAMIRLGNVRWDGNRQEWLGIRAAVVEFTRKPGTGTIHKLGRHEVAGRTQFYPIVQTSRYDTIDRVVNELLTPEENVVRVVDDELLTDPVMRLPRSGPGANPGANDLITHIMVGSERDDNGEYVDKCENHLLLADGYSGLAEVVGGSAQRPSGFAYDSLDEEEGLVRRAVRKMGGIF